MYKTILSVIIYLGVNMKTLEIKDLCVAINGREILKGLNLVVNEGEIHAIMGPNGNGKSTLVQTIMGNPSYQVTGGSIYYDDKNVLEMEINERSVLGIFLAMQYPNEISGVTNSDFLRAAINARNKEPISLFSFIKEIEKNITKLNMKPDLAHRFVNDGFSGGEKKRNEILQMMMLKPSLAMLDEIDSGLDVDAIKYVSDAILDMHKTQNTSMLIVSHYERFFSFIKPTHAHIVIDGKIVCDGDYSLCQKVDDDGYDWLYQELDITPNKNEVDKPIVYSLGSCAHNTSRLDK